MNHQILLRNNKAWEYNQKLFSTFKFFNKLGPKTEQDLSDFRKRTYACKAFPFLSEWEDTQEIAKGEEVWVDLHNTFMYLHSIIIGLRENCENLFQIIYYLIRKCMIFKEYFPKWIKMWNNDFLM